MTVDRWGNITAEASEAISGWSGWSVGKLVSLRENAVFEAHRGQTARAALRLHRRGYQSDRAILSELVLMDHLGMNGVRTPSPVRADDGNLVVRTENGMAADLIGWIDGPRLCDIADEGSADRLERQMYLLGEQLAAIHDISDRFVLPPEFYRPSLNINGLLGPDPVWGRFWENPHLDQKDRDLVSCMREELYDRLEMLLAGGMDYGIIHADALKENVIVNNSAPVLIDYDDCAFGYRIHDIAVALSSWVGKPCYTALREQIIDGYSRRRELTRAEWQSLPMFILIRALACIGWIMDRMEVEGSRERIASYMGLVSLARKEDRLIQS